MDPLQPLQPHWLIRHPLALPLAILGTIATGVWEFVCAHSPDEWRDIQDHHIGSVPQVRKDIIHLL